MATTRKSRVLSRHATVRDTFGLRKLARLRGNPGDVFLIVGPVQGANLLSDAPGFDQVVAEHFAKQLRGLLGPDQNVVVQADFGLDSGSAVAGHSLAVDLTFFAMVGEWNAW